MRRCRRNEAAARDPAADRPVPEQRPLQTAGMVDDPEQSARLQPPIVEALSKVFDPEIPVNIYELGLIYDSIVDALEHRWHPHDADRARMSGRAVSAGAGERRGRLRCRVSRT